MKEVEKLVTHLAGLSEQGIEQAPCSPELRELFKEVSRLKGGARRRQIKYITRLLKAAPLDELYSFLNRQTGSRLQHNKKVHEAEHWRDALINEAIACKEASKENDVPWSEQWDSETVKEVLDDIPKADPASLLRLSFLFAQTHNPRYSRELFRYIMACKKKMIYSGDLETVTGLKQAE